MTKRFLPWITIKIGVQSLMLHKFRSLLTMLGVVFGVASVISMLAIGEGASHEVRERLRRMGPDRITIQSRIPQSNVVEGADILSYGLREDDVDRLRRLIPGLSGMAPCFEIDKEFWYRTHETEVHVIGTTDQYDDIHQLRLQSGRFLTCSDIDSHRSVVVLGHEVARKLFGVREAVGEEIKHSSGHYRVVGVLSPELQDATDGLGANMSVYMPISTAKNRYENVVRVEDSRGKRYERIDIHRLSMQVADVGQMPQIAGMLRKLLDRYHPQNDFEMTVPYELLKESERSKRVFNAVLGSIGGISLLVGGIGIMNIMLATVTERTREIGIRRALGARRRDIVLQFVVESAVLSSIGGLLGLLLGLLVPLVVTRLSHVTTVVTPWSLALALGISVAVGVIFGVVPAHKAAQLEPVAALRH